MHLVRSHPVRLVVLLAVLLSVLLPSGFVVNCVGTDGHHGSEILGVTHCDDSDPDSTTHPIHAADSVMALASADGHGCTDTPLISEVYSRTDQDQSQVSDFSPAPLLFVIDEGIARVANTCAGVLHNEPGPYRPHPAAIRCIILNV